MQSVDKQSRSALIGGPVVTTAGERIEQIVAHHAAVRPESTAVRWGQEELSYRQLTARADEIARSLTAAGIGPSDVVGVQLPRCIDLVCVILGVLKAGAIYTLMPLDWPQDHRREVLERTGSRLCVSRAEDSFDCPQPMVTVDALTHDRVPEPAAAPGPGHLGNLDSACCVFFTSGSTGAPKCAVVPHMGVIRVVLAPVLGFGPSTVMLQSHSPAWDTFAIELWGPLLNGGVCVLRQSEYFSYDDVRHGVKTGVNTVFLTPSVFNGAVTDDPESLSGLDTVVLGGERASAGHIRAFLDRCPGARVFNIYGPVEATICVTVHRLTADDEISGDVPVGAPVPATGIHLLDEARRPVAKGEIGEIAISGDGVAFGYLGDPEGTAGHFPRLPLGEHGKMIQVYLTGDYGRVDDHGLLRFHGRRDRQVKILGTRIEPGKVEQVAGDLPGVTAAAALPIPSGSAEPDGLALIYAAKEQSGPEPDAVRDAIASALPAAFVPRVIHRVDALPTNANGKTDLAAVAGLVSALDTEAGTRRERTPLMTLLIELEALTGVAASADSDVMDLGLRSITALKLIRRVNATHGIRVPMNVIFRSRTPEAIAEWIERH